MEIGERIRIRREELGMSQEELAKAIGYKSRSSINKIEIDGRGLPQGKVVAIAKALHVTPAYLMGWEEADSTAKNDAEADWILDQLRVLTDRNRQRLMDFIEMLMENQESGGR